MYEKIIGIDCRKLDQAAVMAYVTSMAQAIGVGPGNRSGLGSAVGITATDAFRFVLGVPDTWLTTERQRFAEAAFAYTFGKSMTKAHQMWSELGHWSPTNPNAHDSPATGVFDLAFVEPLGLPDRAWDDMLGMTNFIARTKRGTESESDRIRAVMGLFMFGFPDPMQFFTAKATVGRTSKPV